MESLAFYGFAYLGTIFWIGLTILGTTFFWFLRRDVKVLSFDERAHLIWKRYIIIIFISLFVYLFLLFEPHLNAFLNKSENEYLLGVIFIAFIYDILMFGSFIIVIFAMLLNAAVQTSILKKAPPTALFIKFLRNHFVRANLFTAFLIVVFVLGCSIYLNLIPVLYGSTRQQQYLRNLDAPEPTYRGFDPRSFTPPPPPATP